MGICGLHVTQTNMIFIGTTSLDREKITAKKKQKQKNALEFKKSFLVERQNIG